MGDWEGGRRKKNKKEEREGEAALPCCKADTIAPADGRCDAESCTQASMRSFQCAWDGIRGKSTEAGLGSMRDNLHAEKLRGIRHMPRALGALVAGLVYTWVCQGHLGG